MGAYTEMGAYSGEYVNIIDKPHIYLNLRSKGIAPVHIVEVAIINKGCTAYYGCMN